jgi:hypothetical protein
MSAYQLRFDWRLERAAAVLRTGDAFDLGHYAEVFDLDEEETLSLFIEAARHAGVRYINVAPAEPQPTLQ